ncbi:hypothetical protein [Halomonas sp.]|uniref:hypothetical protein n=1 Tax=Halomonas sp. TaxID=1486246 RepID=UPI00338D8E55|nr:hypothetical protein [Halomonas sp.]
MCSPDYAKAHGLSGPLSAQDLSRLSLLHQDIRNPRWLDWAQWCRHAGLTPPPGGGHLRLPQLCAVAERGAGASGRGAGLVEPGRGVSGHRPAHCPGTAGHAGRLWLLAERQAPAQRGDRTGQGLAPGRGASW